MGRRIVVALGGNAIQRADKLEEVEKQWENVRIACEQLAELVSRGYELVITHGNGPQVGDLLLQQEAAIRQVKPKTLDLLVAMTQGQIGYMLQQTLENELKKRGINKPVATVITRVLVNSDDPDFKDPHKPVGPYYTEEEAREVMKRNGCVVKKVDPAREKPYRRVVPSPDPITIVEGEAIRRMVEAGIIVIASGGGGIPVVRDDGELRGVEAVIDKDLAGERLAEVVKADVLLILTDVRKVKLNYGKPNEVDIDRMTVEEAKRYMREGHFLPGSMGPKVLACIRFLEWGGEEAIIASLDEAVDAIEGEAGTHIFRSEKPRVLSYTASTTL